MTARTKEEAVEEFRIRTIQDAAIRVIGRKGLGASMQEIAEEAGIAKGTIYLYFSNQQQLLERTIDDALTLLMAELRTALQSDGSFRQRLEHLIRTEIAFFDARQDLFRIYIAAKYPEGGVNDAKCPRKNSEHQTAWMDVLAGFIREGTASGEFRSVDPGRTALFLHEAVVALIFRRFEEAPAPPVDQDTAAVCSLVLDGILEQRSCS